MSLLSRPEAPPPAPEPEGAAALDCLARADLTAEQLTRRLSTDATGSPLPVPHLPAGVALARIPVADLIAFEPRPEWRTAQQATAAQILEAWPGHLGRHLADTPAGAAVPARLIAVREALAAQHALLAPTAREEATRFARIHADLSREQQRAAPRRGLWGRAIQGAADVFRLSYLHDQHQDRGFMRDVYETALDTARQAADIVRSVESSMTTTREIAAAALQRLDGVTSTPPVAEVVPTPPDWTPATAVVARLLAERAAIQSQVMDLLVAPAPTAEALLSRVQAEAAQEARQITGGLTLEALLNLMRGAEGYPETLDVYEALIQHALRAAYARRFARATRTRARTTLIELTPDGQPECGDALAPVPIFSGPAGSPHQFGWLEFQHGLAPSDLSALRSAHEALTTDQVRRNNLLLEEQVCAERAGAAPPAAPSLTTRPSVPPIMMPVEGPAFNGAHDTPVPAGG